VALPDEHGGWSLSAEPALLGMLVAPSWAGLAIALAAILAFVVRTPVKVVLVDLRRHRTLGRTALAARIAAVELAGLAVLAAVAGLRAGWSWLLPVAVAVPLVGVELWFDMRSRSRRLVPELCGAVGIASVAAAIALAGGAAGGLSVALWLVLAARSVSAIPFVRVQIARLHGRPGADATSDRAQAAGVAMAAVAFASDATVVLGAASVALVAMAQVWWTRRPPVPAKALGLRQLAVGICLVVVTAVGVEVLGG
jgi:hypothetical protein